MRLSSSNIVAFIAIATVESTLEADESDVEETPSMVTSREFNPPEMSAWDVVVSPLYIPERLMKMVFYPVGRLTAWALRNSIPDRIIDLISDDTRRIWFFPAADYSSTHGLSLGGSFRFENMFYQQKNLSASGMFYANLDRRISVSYGQAASFVKPLQYGLSVKHDLDTDSDFYGAGIDSIRSDKSIFTRQNTSINFGVGSAFRRLPYLRIRGQLGLDMTSSGPGRSRGNEPRVEDRFPLDTLDGLGESIYWIRYGLRITYDTRIPSGFPNRGWLVSGRATRFEDVRGRFSYLETAVKVSTLIGLFRDHNVLALAIRAFAVESFSGEVPFYRLGTLDRKSPLRGFSGGRFRDKRTVLGNIEYRFLIWKSMRDNPFMGIGTFFLDLGKPFHNFDSFIEGGVLYSVGTGFILTRASGPLVRAQIGYGGEGIESILSFGHSF